MYDTTRARKRYQRLYYLANKHRKKYTYIKKGVMKRLSPTQYKIVQLIKSGVRIYAYYEAYRYWRGARTTEVNLRSVECLIASKHVAVVNHVLELTEKGNNHIQSIPKCRKTLAK